MNIKNSYESVIIMNGTFIEEEYKKSLEEIKERIKNIIDIEKIEENGLKKIAYEIQKI